MWVQRFNEDPENGYAVMRLRATDGTPIICDGITGDDQQLVGELVEQVWRWRGRVFALFERPNAPCEGPESSGHHSYNYVATWTLVSRGYRRRNP